MRLSILSNVTVLLSCISPKTVFRPAVPLASVVNPNVSVPAETVASKEVILSAVEGVPSVVILAIVDPLFVTSNTSPLLPIVIYKFETLICNVPEKGMFIVNYNNDVLEFLGTLILPLYISHPDFAVTVSPVPNVVSSASVLFSSLLRSIFANLLN